MGEAAQKAETASLTYDVELTEQEIVTLTIWLMRTVKTSDRKDRRALREAVAEFGGEVYEAKIRANENIEFLGAKIVAEPPRKVTVQRGTVRWVLDQLSKNGPIEGVFNLILGDIEDKLVKLDA